MCSLKAIALSESLHPLVNSKVCCGTCGHNSTPIGETGKCFRVPSVTKCVTSLSYLSYVTDGFSVHTSDRKSR